MLDSISSVMTTSFIQMTKKIKLQISLCSLDDCPPFRYFVPDGKKVICTSMVKNNLIHKKRYINFNII